MLVSHGAHEREKHGNAIVTPPQVHFLENFNIQLPDERGKLLLVEQEVEGFEDDPSKLTRSKKNTLRMRLNKGITGKLENAGYITKEKRGVRTFSR